MSQATSSGTADDLTGDSITAFDACALSNAIRSREVSCREVMSAVLDRVALLNPRVNAIVSFQPRDDLLAQADARDAQLARGDQVGWIGQLGR